MLKIETLDHFSSLTSLRSHLNSPHSSGFFGNQTFANNTKLSVDSKRHVEKNFFFLSRKVRRIVSLTKSLDGENGTLVMETQCSGRGEISMTVTVSCFSVCTNHTPRFRLESHRFIPGNPVFDQDTNRTNEISLSPNPKLPNHLPDKNHRYEKEHWRI